MTKTNGQVIRRIGLIFQAICFLGLISIKHKVGKMGDPAQLARLNWELTGLALGFGIGFVTWAVGTWAIYRGRRSTGGESTS